MRICVHMRCTRPELTLPDFTFIPWLERVDVLPRFFHAERLIRSTADPVDSDDGCSRFPRIEVRPPPTRAAWGLLRIHTCVYHVSTNMHHARAHVHVHAHVHMHVQAWLAALRARPTYSRLRLDDESLCISRTLLGYALKSSFHAASCERLCKRLATSFDYTASALHLHCSYSIDARLQRCVSQQNAHQYFQHSHKPFKLEYE